MKKLTLLKIVEIKHIAKDGSIIWQSKNLSNTFHTSGEEFCLRAIFVGGQTSTVIPEDYYFGLDNRTTITTQDTMDTIELYGAEPSGEGYFRQAVSSQDQFQMSVGSSGHAIATSPIITFVASNSGSGWGSISNLFLTDKANNTGYLISSVALDQAITVAPGEGVYMRMTLMLGNDPNLPSV